MSNNVTTGYRTSLTELRFKRSSVLNLSVKLIVFFSLLNISWYFINATGLTGKVLFIVPLGLLLFFYWPYAICNRFILASGGPIWIYVLIAITYGISTDVNNYSLVIPYVANTVLIAIIAIHIIRSEKEAVDDIVRFSRNVLLILPVSIILTPYVSFFQDTNFNFNYRSSGIFLNPNEASLASVFLLNFIFYRPYNKQILNYFVITLVAVSVALTFSKIGIILFVFSLILFLWFKHKLFFFFTLLALVVSVSRMEQFFIFLQNYFASRLSFIQMVRLNFMRSFFDGQLNSQSTGYKSFLWSVAYSIIRDTFPHGLGLGTFHELVGYVYADEVGHWYGVHNMYLMIAGEAGFFVFALFVACYGSLLVFAFFSSKDRLPFAIISNIFIFAMTSHNSLEHEFQVVLFAIAIGLLGRKTASHPMSP